MEAASDSNKKTFKGDILEKIARTLSRNYGITLSFKGTQAKTNGKRIIIPAMPEKLSDEMIIKLRGYCDHEIGHVRFTDHRAPRKAGLDPNGSVFKLANLLEDFRIEKKMGDEYEGCRKNLEALAQLLRGQMAEKGTDDHIMNKLWIEGRRQVCRHELDGDYADEIDCAFGEGTIEKIKALRSTMDCIDLAKELLKNYEDQMTPPPEAGESDDEESKDKDSEDGEGEPDGSGDSEDCDDPAADESGSSGSETDDDGDKDKGTNPEESEDDEPDESPESGGGDSGEDEYDSDDSDEGEDESGEDESGEDESDPSGGSDEDEDKDDEGSEGESGIDETYDEDSDADADDDTDDEGSADDTEGEDADADAETESKADRSDGEDKTPNHDEVDDEMPVPPEYEPVTDDLEDWKDESEDITKDLEKVARDESGDNYTVFCKDYDILEPYDPKDRYGREIDFVGIYNRLKDDLGAMNSIKNKVASMFLAKTQARWFGGQERGRIDARTLATVQAGNRRVFKKKVFSRERDTATLFLVDWSGSMHGSRVKNAMMAVVMFLESLAKTKVKTEVLAYTTKGLPRSVYREMSSVGIRWGRVEALVTYIIKAFEEPFNKAVKERIGGYRNAPLKENCDGENVLIAWKRLKARNERRKVLFVLTDGCVANLGDYIVGRKYLKEVCQMIKRDGEVELVGIGISAREGAKYYDNFINLRDSENLPSVLFGECRKILKV